jgi:hypothetical protein
LLAIWDHNNCQAVNRVSDIGSKARYTSWRL